MQIFFCTISHVETRLRRLIIKRRCFSHAFLPIQPNSSLFIFIIIVPYSIYAPPFIVWLHLYYYDPVVTTNNRRYARWNILHAHLLRIRHPFLINSTHMQLFVSKYFRIKQCEKLYITLDNKYDKAVYRISTDLFEKVINNMRNAFFPH